MHSASTDADSYCYADPCTQSHADCDTMADDRYAHFCPCVDPNANALSDAPSTTQIAQATNPTFAAYTVLPADTTHTDPNTSPSSS